MNGIEGQININLYSQNSHGRTEIDSTRLLHASKILLGKSPEQVLSVIPLLFNICGIAQSHAAYLALEQKLGIQKNPAHQAAQELLLLVENARENLLRLFLDAPRLFQLDYKNTDLSYLSQITKEFSNALFYQGKAFSFDSQLNNKLENVSQLIDRLETFLEAHIYQTPIDSWLNYKNNNLQRWAKAGDSFAATAMNKLFETDWGLQGATNCQVLPTLDNNALLEILNTNNAEHFIAQPQWQGQCFETTALSRQIAHPLIQELYLTYSSGLATRWIARLIELANIPVQMRLLHKQLTESDFSDQPSDSDEMSGIAQVEAARGRLIHRVDMDQGVISQYQILAPTEWNFHPRGMLSKSLENLDSEDIQELEQLAHLMINTYDPCVGYQLRVH